MNFSVERESERVPGAAGGGPSAQQSADDSSIRVPGEIRLVKHEADRSGSSSWAARRRVAGAAAYISVRQSMPLTALGARL